MKGTRQSARFDQFGPLPLFSQEAGEASEKPVTDEIVRTHAGARCAVEKADALASRLTSPHFVE